MKTPVHLPVSARSLGAALVWAPLHCCPSFPSIPAALALWALVCPKAQIHFLPSFPKAAIGT